MSETAPFGPSPKGLTWAESGKISKIPYYGYKGIGKALRPGFRVFGRFFESGSAKKRLECPKTVGNVPGGLCTHPGTVPDRYGCIRALQVAILARDPKVEAARVTKGGGDCNWRIVT